MFLSLAVTPSMEIIFWQATIQNKANMNRKCGYESAEDASYH